MDIILSLTLIDLKKYEDLQKKAKKYDPDMQKSKKIWI